MAWNHDHHDWHRRPHAECAHVFVSAELDGWTLVFGNSSQDTHRIGDSDDPEDILAHEEALARVHIAARLSVDPGALGPKPRVSGSGVLALTACGREHGHPAGTPRI